MDSDQDFERAWLGKLSRGIIAGVGQDIGQAVMQGSERLTSNSPRSDVIEWSIGAMDILDELVDDEGLRRSVMIGCACQYPRQDLQDVRDKYHATRDLELAHQMLQLKFEAFLRDTLELSNEHIEDVVARNWGLAGVLEENTIIATKIPKSRQLKAYLEEPDPEIRRQLYCHCPRVRDMVKSKEKISLTYCYCGAGFYQGIWEEILQQPVTVEVLESVLSGGDECRIAIHLPTISA
jgi:predicted hydrocarbon binding protein